MCVKCEIEGYNIHTVDIEDSSIKTVKMPSIKFKKSISKAKTGYWVSEGYNWGGDKNCDWVEASGERIFRKTKSAAIGHYSKAMSEYFKWLGGRAHDKREALLDAKLEPLMLKTVSDWYGTESNSDSISHRVYKETCCGAWATLSGRVATIGSIVEGVDWGTDPIELVWPFTKSEWYKAIECTEYEAKKIWNETHGCEKCPENVENGMRFIDPDCKSCKGQGDII